VSQGKKQRVRAVTTLLGLDQCKDTKIGSQRLKGISGGEKRRVSIGVEIISDPAIVFLDEPTSGLDFVTALSVVKTMRRMARSGKIVIATIHQPSSEIFHLFDDLLLLHGGRIAYHGTVLAAEEHFKTSGYTCPLHYNPADHYLSVLNDPSKASKVVELQSTRKAGEAGDLVVKVSRSYSALPPLLEDNEPTAGVLTQMWHLIAREMRSYYRDPWHILTHIGIALFMGSFLGYLCEGAGANDSEISTAKGSLFVYQECLFTGLDTMLFKGIFGRGLFNREHRVGTYTIFSYVLAMVVVSIPMCIMFSFCELLPYLFMVGWQGSHWLVYLVFFLTHMNGAVSGLVIGFIAGRADLAAAAIPIAIVPQIYLAGMFRPSATVPVALRWMQWITTLKYGYSAILIIEFGDDDNHFTNAPNWTKEDTAHFKEMHFKQNYINPENPWDDFAFYTTMPMVMYCGLIAVAMIVLKIHALRR